MWLGTSTRPLGQEAEFRRQLSMHSNGHGLAPIALFVFNRPDHTRRTLQALAANRLTGESSLFIFSDGPRNNQDIPAVAEVRQIIRDQAWPGRVTIREQSANRGLAHSIVSGVTELIDCFGRVIVLEDDLLTAPCFLEYMNEGLRRYADRQDVMQVSAYLAPIDSCRPEQAFFLPLTTSWGWGTWKRAWDQFDATAAGYERLMQDAALQRSFDIGGIVDYTGMLRDSREGKNASWAVRWYLSVFLRGGLTLYPGRSLVKNIGFDGSGTHCDTCAEFHTEHLGHGVIDYPACATVDVVRWESLQRHLSTTSTRHVPASRSRFRSPALRLAEKAAVAVARCGPMLAVRQGVRSLKKKLRQWVVHRRVAMRDRLAIWIHGLVQRGRELATIGEFSREATMEPGVRLFPEAVVRNLRGDARRICIGSDTVVRGELLVFAHEGAVSIGHGCYVGEGTRIWSSANIVIGNRVLISHDVDIHDTNSHPIDAQERHQHFMRIMQVGHPRSDVRIAAKPITIEDDVWIGFGASILKGVTIGRGAIVAACSVVVADVPAFAMVAGNPAKVVKYHETQAHAA